MSARALGPERYAPLSVLWSAVFLVVPAVWLPLEGELSRRIAATHAAGAGSEAILRTGRRFGVVVALVLVVGVASTAPLTVDVFFDGVTPVVAAFALAMAVFGTNHLTRAVLAGSGSFRRFGLAVALDSGSRLAMATALAVAGVDSVGPYAFAVALAPLVPAVALFPRSGPHRAPGPALRLGALGATALPLMGAQLLAQILVNGGPRRWPCLRASETTTWRAASSPRC